MLTEQSLHIAFVLDMVQYDTSDGPSLVGCTLNVYSGSANAFDVGAEDIGAIVAAEAASLETCSRGQARGLLQHDADANEQTLTEVAQRIMEEIGLS
ncbi:MAG: hypothetical protein JWN99_1780 [Ilumatobacteraceae bacterium]|nr:hypothetical protein [Ilumatobacteraceae bacterium]